jgi:hypothetical protein
MQHTCKVRLPLRGSGRTAKHKADSLLKGVSNATKQTPAGGMIPVVVNRCSVHLNQG